MTDRVRLPRLYLAWLTPRLFAPGDAALDVLSSVLAGGKNSRLYKRLVYDTQMAQDVSAYQASGALGSSFQIVATARPGHTVAEMQKAIDEEIERLKREPPDAREVQRALNQIEASFYRRMERVGGFYGKADQLNAYFAAGGGPDFFAEDLARYTTLTAGRHAGRRARVAARRSARRAGGRAGGEEVSDAAGCRRRPVCALSAAVAAQERPDRSKPPALGPVARLTLPPIQKRTLSNGLPVWIVESHEVPLVQVNLVVHAGSGDDPAGEFGAGQPDGGHAGRGRRHAQRARRSPMPRSSSARTSAPPARSMRRPSASTCPRASWSRRCPSWPTWRCGPRSRRPSWSACARSG